MSSKSKMKVLLVEWEDIASYGTWRDHSDDFSPLPIRSVGILLREDKRKLILFQTQDTHGKVSEVLVIPKAVISKRKIIASV